jgi:hypothetical protein
VGRDLGVFYEKKAEAETTLEKTKIMNTKTLRIAAAAAATFALAIPATAFACGGEGGKAKGAHFQKSDKNQDGFLTEAEVGAERWTRIKVADANNDKKVSKDEMKAAKKAGKLGKHRAHKSS